MRVSKEDKGIILKVIEEEKLIKEKIYISEDGERFKNERDCLFHEFRKKANKIWIVFPRERAYLNNILFFEKYEEADAYSISNRLEMKEIILGEDYFRMCLNSGRM